MLLLLPASGQHPQDSKLQYACLPRPSWSRHNLHNDAQVISMMGPCVALKLPESIDEQGQRFLSEAELSVSPHHVCVSLICDREDL